MRYFVKTPGWLRLLYSSYVWKIPTERKVIYLTFDDGPHPEITNYVLDQLEVYNAKASFFCIGSNVVKYPAVFERIKNSGHSIGNHTHTHLNGWHVKREEYINDIAEAASIFETTLFRPPYGRILRSQAKRIPAALGKRNARIVMWDVLSGDFDTSLTQEQCLHNVIDNAGKGSIIVFHDSEKANRLLQYSLPRTLDFFSEKGFEFKNLKELSVEE